MPPKTRYKSKTGKGRVKVGAPKEREWGTNKHQGGGGADPIPKTKTKTKTKIKTGVDPKLQQAVKQQKLQAYNKFFNQPSGTGISGLGGVNAPLPGSGTGGKDNKIVPVKIKKTETKETETKETKETENKDNANKTAEELTKWWADHSKKNKLYEKYRERKNILTGKLWGSQEAVTAKLRDKLNKGYYKIVNGPDDEPLIVHASTGTPVNPYTGNIISTQTSGDRGGAYQNEMARITGIDKKFAGVFSKEYQTGNGLSVSEMKPEHALRFLMSKNKGAFEQFFNLNKEKAGFNPFSMGFISTGMGAILNMITGPEALQVGNNLERAGWGKAIKGKDGKYKIQLSKTGAEKWSDSFNFDTVNIGDKTFSGFTSPEAIAKDKSKGFLSEFLGTKKFPDQPIDLTNLMSQGVDGEGGYFQGSDLVAGQTGQPFDPNTFDPMNPKGANLATLDPNLTPNVKFQPQYGYMPPIKELGSKSPLPGTPPSQYPEFTSQGYNISNYNPSKDYSSQGGGGGGGGQGDGGQSQETDDTTPSSGPLTFDVHGRPITNYDYTGGPEQMYVGGGYKRDGKYIGSPWGYSEGGIANFKPYGY